MRRCVAVVAGFVGARVVQVFSMSRVGFYSVSALLGDSIEILSIPIAGTVCRDKASFTSSRPDFAAGSLFDCVAMNLVSTILGKRLWIASAKSWTLFGGGPKKVL